MMNVRNPKLTRSDAVESLKFCTQFQILRQYVATDKVNR